MISVQSAIGNFAWNAVKKYWRVAINIAQTVEITIGPCTKEKIKKPKKQLPRDYKKRPKKPFRRIMILIPFDYQFG